MTMKATKVNATSFCKQNHDANFRKENHATVVVVWYNRAENHASDCTDWIPLVCMSIGKRPNLALMTTLRYFWISYTKYTWQCKEKKKNLLEFSICSETSVESGSKARPKSTLDIHCRWWMSNWRYIDVLWLLTCRWWMSNWRRLKHQSAGLYSGA